MSATSGPLGDHLTEPYIDDDGDYEVKSKGEEEIESKGVKADKADDIDEEEKLDQTARVEEGNKS